MAESTSMPVPAPPFAEIVADSTSAELKNTKFVMMIGSTGNGKSTLGNFLLCPAREHCVYTYGNQTFAGAVANLPLTQEVKMATDLNRTICLMDTPGLNENPKKDLEHMVAIIRCLKAAEKLTACILCVKFDSKIDMQYKETIEYYSKLFPGIFETNVILVMTCFGMDLDSIERRKDNGIDVAKIRANTVEAVKKCANIKASPKVFMIDCLPTTSGREESENVRSCILEYIEGMKPIPLKDLHVRKTGVLLGKDKLKAGILQGEIEAKQKELQKGKDAAVRSQLQKINALNLDLSSCKEEIAEKENELSLFDSSKEVIVDQWFYESTVNWGFGRPKESFHLQSKEWDIARVSREKSGSCMWKDVTETLHDVKGAIRKTGMGKTTMGASITIYTEKRRKYEKNVTDLKAKIKILESKKKSTEKKRDEANENADIDKKELAELESCIEMKTKERIVLLKEYLTIKEATERLEELKTT